MARIYVHPWSLSHEAYTLPIRAPHIKHGLDIMQFGGDHCRELERLELNLEELTAYPAYSPSEQALEMEIRTYLRLSDQKILFTHGSDNALELICRTLMSSQTDVIVPIPTYPHFLQFAEIQQCRLHTIPLNPRARDVSELMTTLDGVVKHLSKDDSRSSVVYLCNPNMPYGYTFSMAQLSRLIAESPQTMWIVDEAYMEFTEEPYSACDLMEKWNNLIVVRTFSKAFGLAALRIGYLVATPSWHEILSTMHNPKSVTELAKRAALVVIRNRKWYLSQVQRVQQLKKYLSRRLREALSVGNRHFYDFHVADGNYFLLFSNDPSALCVQFDAFQIAARNKHTDISNSVRLTMPAKHSVVQAILTALEVPPNPKVYLDLDFTVRHGSKKDSPIYEDILQFIDHFREDWNIVTNNASHTHTEIVESLRKQGIVGGYTKRIFTPIDALLKLQLRNPLIIATSSVRKLLREVYGHSVLGYDAVVVLSDFYNVHADEIVEICRLLRQGLPFYVSELSLRTTALGCSDCEHTSAEIEIPDLGTWVKMFEGISAQPPQILGKPFKLLIDEPLETRGKPLNDETLQTRSVVIGDSLHTDQAFAKSLGSGTHFIYVDHSQPMPHKELCDYFGLVPAG